MSKADFQTVIAALHRKAEEKPPLAPYKPMKRAPTGFDYESRTLVGPEDARKIRQTLDALDARAQQISELDTSYTDLRTEVEDKIRNLKEEQGYEQVKSEMAGFAEKLTAEVESSMDFVENALIEHKNTLLAVVEQTTKGSATSAEIKQAMVDAMKKYLDDDVVGNILKDADEAVKALVEAKKKVKRQLTSWPSPKDLRKKVKQEIPKTTAAGIMDTLKDLGQWLKSVWDGLKDSLSSLVSSVERGQPEIDEMKSLLAEAGVTASKKHADFIDRNEAGVRHDYAEKLKEFLGAEGLLDSLISALGDDKAVDALKYVAQTQGIDDVYNDIENDAGMRHDYAAALTEVMGADAVLDNLVRALSDDEALSNFDYIVRMNDLRQELEEAYGNADTDADTVVSALKD